MKHARLGLALLLLSASTLRADLMKDSPVTFPEKGALPARFSPDVKTESLPVEPDYFLFTSPCRSREQIGRIRAEMPPGHFSAPSNDWRHLERTRLILQQGGDLRLLALGDSIVNDTMRSGWVALLREAYPAARIAATVYVRGGGGCQHYRESNRVERFLLPQKPDLVLIGGISQRDTDSIREVIRQIRAARPDTEFLLATGAFGTTDPRDDAALAQAAHSGTGPYGERLRALAAEERCAFLDMTTPWAEVLRSAGVHPHRFYRDAVHANEFGEQVLARILMAFWAPQDAWLADRLDWFQDQKFGFMMHWAPYSQWGCIESWPLVEVDKWTRPDDLPAWTERGRDMERFKRDYWRLPKTFNPVKFDPARWAETARAGGMKYVVFTTKHHDGFCLFDTRLTDYRITAPDVPFHTNARANVVRGVFDAFRAQGLGIGAYFSKADWHCPDYWDPGAPSPTRNPNYDTLARPDKWARFVAFTHGQIEELMTGYGPIDILWLDAGQVRPPKQDIQMDKLVAMARGHQPRLIVVDRTVGGRHENYRTPEQQVPDQPLSYVWESCLTMGDQWSYKPNDKYKSAGQLIRLLVDIVGKGGNLLLNVGPQPDGELPAAAVERMQAVGAWLAVNGGAIYGTRPLAPYREGAVVYTAKGATVNAIWQAADDASGLPEQIALASHTPPAGAAVRLLGADAPLAWRSGTNGVAVIDIPPALRQQPPAPHAWVLQWTDPRG